MDKIREVLDSAKSIVITTHKSPDGDAIGSSLALYHFLKKKGKDVTVIVPDAFPVFLNWMKETDNIVHYDTQTEEADKIISETDIIFSLDYNSLTRISDLRNPIERKFPIMFLFLLVFLLL